MDNGCLKKHYAMFTDIWKLFKNYSAPDRSEMFWAGYKAEVDRLDKKYHSAVLFRDLVLAVTKELDRIEKQE